MEKILKPKVFISYAWTNDSYKEKVRDFAKNLMDDSIDVVIDIFDLKPGQDMNSFMEKSVNDASVTNVLILLNKEYAEKADGRMGGVGTETQILSNEVYKSVEQEKILPIIFEKGSKGEVYKPAYLESRIHFDLASPEQFEREYVTLVKRLCGNEVSPKPNLGPRPKWVDENETVNYAIRGKIKSIKRSLSPEERDQEVRGALHDIQKAITECFVELEEDFRDETIISSYISSLTVRNDYLDLICALNVGHKDIEILADFFEVVYSNSLNQGIKGEFQLTLLHEVFLYTIAILYRNRRLDAIGYIFGKTYFITVLGRRQNDDYRLFCNYNTKLDNAISNRDGKKYLCGTAHFWLENLHKDACTRDELTFADLLCFQYSIFGKENRGGHPWFPITHNYSNQNQVFIDFSFRFMSTEHVNRVSTIFGYDSIEEFKDSLEEGSKRVKEGVYRGIRYMGAFGRAPIIFDHVELEQIGAKR